MQMKRGMAVGLLGAVLAVLVGAGSCDPAPTVSGTVKDKYIEDFTEPTLVVKEADGDVHHFTVEWDVYNSHSVGQTYSQTQSYGEDD